MLKNLNLAKLNSIYKQIILNSAFTTKLPNKIYTPNINITQNHLNKNKSFKIIKNVSNTFATNTQAKKKRISDINNFFSNENGNYLFTQTSTNKSLMFYYCLIHLPFCLASVSLGLNLNLLEIDMIRLGIKSLFITQGIITGINISSIINCVDMKLTRIKQIKILELEAEEIKQEISNSNSIIYIAFVPLVINFVVSQIFVNFPQISNFVLSMCSVGLISSNLINLIILGGCVLKKNNLSLKNSSLFRINLLFAILNVICYFFILNYLRGTEYKIKNPFLMCNDIHRIENLKTMNECVKEDTKKIESEIAELMDEITPEQIELIEKIFKDED